MNKSRSAAACAAVAIVLSGCASAPSQPPDVPVTKVIDQLKYELAVFALATDGKEFEFVGGPRCGSTGKFKMGIKNIEVKLSTEITNAAALSGGLAAPLGAGAVTLGPTANFGRTVYNSQVITLNLEPGILNGKTPTGDNSDLRLASALIGLRDQLLAVKDSGQCVKFSDKGDSKLALAFTAENVNGGGVKFNLVVLSLDASDKQTTKVGNTLTVTLALDGTQFFRIQ